MKIQPLLFLSIFFSLLSCQSTSNNQVSNPNDSQSNNQKIAGKYYTNDFDKVTNQYSIGLELTGSNHFVLSGLFFNTDVVGTYTIDDGYVYLKENLNNTDRFKIINENILQFSKGGIDADTIYLVREGTAKLYEKKSQHPQEPVQKQPLKSLVNQLKVTPPVIAKINVDTTLTTALKKFKNAKSKIKEDTITDQNISPNDVK